MTNSVQEIEVFENMGLCGWVCFVGILEPNEHSNQKYLGKNWINEFWACGREFPKNLINATLSLNAPPPPPLQLQILNKRPGRLKEDLRYVLYVCILRVYCTCVFMAY